ncbi:uncharacterized protein BKCO1_1300060 [Diplodia corticola]|uniref:Uncharacterized protein n=1 Tax=Diplodia corticola TaxID=236234 RepID=A0A1J9S830_9PEZI|nr:uncharacterized protein BKCO1_1300060 [Diplodia corticola]OJD36068.1 hypothetical protein BKCO1_1300060 [Diplodia corticola]
MGVPTHRETAVADHEGENLSAFLHRINFSLDSAGESPHKPSSASLNGVASADHLTSGSFKLPPLQTKTNNFSLKPVTSARSVRLAEGTRGSLQKETTALDDFQCQNPHHPRLISHLDSERIPAEKLPPVSPSVSRRSSKTQTLGKETPPSERSDRSRHELPVYALAQTLRASSIGATMAPGIPNEGGGLGWSKYAPSAQSDGSSGSDLNQRTAETIARQAEIDARLSKLRSRREPTPRELQDESRRLELITAQKAADEEHARVKAEKKKQAEVEAARFESERLRREKDEQERAKREWEEAERLKREKEEAARLKREKEERERLEAERAKREREEAERLEAERVKREKKEAERLEAERIKREKEEAEEAALRAALYERIDEMEEDGLSKTQAMQLALQKSIEQSTVRQEQISKDIVAKKSEIAQSQQVLQRLQHEFQELHDAEISLVTKLEVDTKECFELQTVSERIIERASHMRKEVEGKELRSLDLITAFEVPQKSQQQILLNLLKTDSAADSTKASQEAVETQHPQVKIEDNDTSRDGESQSEVVYSMAGPAEDGKAENPGSIEPKSLQQKTKGDKSLEHKLQFDEWPTQEVRPFGGAQKRLVKLTNLPLTSSIGSIQALVWGGRIEKFEYTPGSNHAWVLFMRGQDCEKYLTDTANGIEHPDGNRTVWVEMGEPVTVNESLRGFFDAGHTRCVRAVGADEDWGEAALVKLASAKNRKLERIVNGANPKGLRVIEFRFTNIVDAGRFKVELQNDIDWEHCNVYFGNDPCEDNTGIHQGVQ